MTSKLSGQYGFDTSARRARLHCLELADAERQLVPRLQAEVIRPNMDTIVSRFYEKLLANNETAAILGDPGTVERLRQHQSTYLLTLGVDFDSDQYVEERIRIGVTHARIGLPISLYMCAYRMLQDILIDCFPATYGADLGLLRRMVSLVLKLTTFDMSVGAEAYHRSEVKALESTIDDSRRREAVALEQSLTDALTGIANRRHVLDVLRASVGASNRRLPRVAVLMLDLDNFKQVNDQHGHQVGDQVLCDVARRIHATIRGFDVVGRYGGEEFLVVLHGTEQLESTSIAERIRQRIAATPISVDGIPIPMTVSIGLCDQQPGDSLETLIGRADSALYAAKAAGKNQTYAFGGV